jgi:hypothetical protein
MGRRAQTGTCMAALVELALPLLRDAECQRPRTGPGSKPQVPDWLMATLIMIALLQRKKTKSAQYRYLCEQRALIATWCDDDRFPSRATYFRRYRQAHRLYREAIRLQGRCAMAEGVVDATEVAVDKSLLGALGPPWHRQDCQAGRTRPGVDAEARWGYSEHHGWVYGFSYEIVVSATPTSTVFPLLASLDTANVSEARTFLDKIEELPAQTVIVSADSGYDANHVGERIEYDERQRPTGRHFLCPANPRNGKRPKTKPCHADAARARSRQRRHRRLQFLASRRGRELYARRKQTVEPFNQWFKSLYEVHERVWHRGLDNNRTQILGAIFIYQLLVRYNHRCGHRNGRVKWILDRL